MRSPDAVPPESEDNITSPPPTIPEGPTESVEAFVIPLALAQATLEYLAAQPYREVFALVRGFETLEPLPKSKTYPTALE